MSILPKAIYRLNIISTKISMAYFTDLEQIVQKCIWNHKRAQIASAILRKKRKKLEGSQYLISNYTIRPLQSKQSGTGIRADVEINGTE